MGFSVEGVAKEVRVKISGEDAEEPENITLKDLGRPLGDTGKAVDEQLGGEIKDW